MAYRLPHWFTLLKYTVYTLLMMNVFLFLQEELLALEHTFSNGFALTDAIQAILYSILLGAAIYWGFAGDFLDFWDAFLWLFAFVFIALNVFDWQAETQAELQEVQGY